MKAGSAAPDANRLLEHAGFLRALSLGLLRDETEAEDNVQETWLEAIRHPPRHRRNLRAWLGTLARHLALRRRRAAARRGRRERAAARPDAVCSTAERAMRHELRRAVVAAVLALEEPYRSTVILRYFRELEPRAIARHQGVPLETVRTRLRRARNQLRVRLDRTHGGNRRLWTVALAAAALGARPARAASIAKLAMGVAVFCVVGTGYAVFRMEGRRPRSGPPRSAARRPPPAVSVPQQQPARPREVLRAGAPVAAPTPGVRLLEPAPGPGVVSGRVRILDGRSPRGAQVLLYRRGKPGARTEVDAAGAFRFWGVEPGRYEIAALHGGCAIHKFRFDLRAAAGKKFEILLGAGGSLQVQVLGAWGAPEPGVAVEIRERQAWRPVVLEGITDGQGRWLEANLAALPYRVRAEPGLERFVTVVPGRTVEVVFERGCGVGGSVAGPRGEPLENAIVRLIPAGSGSYRQVQARTDAGGRYELRGLPAGRYAIQIQVAGPDGFMVNAGTLELAPGRILDHPLRVEARTLSGRVTRADTGAPLDQRAVQITATAVADGSISMAFAGETGRYAFSGLAPGRYRIRVASHLPGLRDAERTIELAAGDLTDVDFALETPPLGLLRLRVLEPDGSPATGVSFWIRRPTGRRSLRGRQVGDGLFELSLEAGRRTILVTRAGFSAEPLAVVVKEHRTVAHTLRLRRP